MRILNEKPRSHYPWWIKAGLAGGILWWAIFFAVAMSADWASKHGSDAKFFNVIVGIAGFPIFDAGALVCGDSHSMRAHFIPFFAWPLNGSFWAVLVTGGLRVIFAGNRRRRR